MDVIVNFLSRWSNRLISLMSSRKPSEVAMSTSYCMDSVNKIEKCIAIFIVFAFYESYFLNVIILKWNTRFASWIQCLYATEKIFLRLLLKILFYGRFQQKMVAIIFEVDFSTSNFFGGLCLFSSNASTLDSGSYWWNQVLLYGWKFHLNYSDKTAKKYLQFSNRRCLSSIVYCEHSRNPTCTNFSHIQIFMQYLSNLFFACISSIICHNLILRTASTNVSTWSPRHFMCYSYIASKGY